VEIDPEYLSMSESERDRTRGSEKLLYLVKIMCLRLVE